MATPTSNSVPFRPAFSVTSANVPSPLFRNKWFQYLGESFCKVSMLAPLAKKISGFPSRSKSNTATPPAIVSGACLWGVSLLSNENAIGWNEKWIGALVSCGLIPGVAKKIRASHERLFGGTLPLRFTRFIVPCGTAVGFGAAQFFDLSFLAFCIICSSSCFVSAHQIPMDPCVQRIIVARNLEFLQRTSQVAVRL